MVNILSMATSSTQPDLRSHVALYLCPGLCVNLTVDRSGTVQIGRADCESVAASRLDGIRRIPNSRPARRGGGGARTGVVRVRRGIGRNLTEYRRGQGKEYRQREKTAIASGAKIKIPRIAVFTLSHAVGSERRTPKGGGLAQRWRTIRKASNRRLWAILALVIHSRYATNCCRITHMRRCLCEFIAINMFWNCSPAVYETVAGNSQAPAKSCPPPRFPV